MSLLCCHYTNPRCIWLREEELHLHRGYKPTVVMSHKCYYYIIPQCLYKRQDLHLHDLVAYQSTSDEVMSVCRLSSRFERFHHSCVFNLQYVKELCKFRCLNLCLLYQNIRCCFRLSDKILNFLIFKIFGGGGGNRTPVLLR